MSHYTTAKVPIRSEEDLIAGLVAAGIPRNAIESHETPVNLYGYRGDKRTDVAHVVVRRQAVNDLSGGSSNDVGFVRLPDGSWQEIVSDYDQSWWVRGRKARETVMQGATVARLVREAAGSGVQLEATYTTKNGKRVASLRLADPGRSRSRQRTR